MLAQVDGIIYDLTLVRTGHLAERESGLAPDRWLLQRPHRGDQLLIKKVKRVGHGFRNFANYRLRLLLHCGVTWQLTGPRDCRYPRMVA